MTGRLGSGPGSAPALRWNPQSGQLRIYQEKAFLGVSCAALSPSS